MKQLSKKEIKELNEKIREAYPDADLLNVKENTMQEDNVVKIGGTAKWFLQENKVIPTLRYLLERNFMKTITVDMGAVKFVTKGADVFRPGITKIDPSIKAGESVCIVDETHNKPLAIGIALSNAADMQAQQGGKAVKMVHYVGDELWKK